MDNQQFETLILENRENIYRLALRITGNRQEALDVVQETLLAAYRSRLRFRGEARVSTYLYRIGVNFSFAALKKRKNRAYVPLEKVREIEEKGANPARAFREGEVAAHLKRLVDGLPPRQKAAIHLRIYEGLAFNEVAAALGCRPATARTLFFFGVKALRKQADGLIGRLGEDGESGLAAALAGAAEPGEVENGGT